MKICEIVVILLLNVFQPGTAYDPTGDLQNASRMPPEWCLQNVSKLPPECLQHGASRMPPDVFPVYELAEGFDCFCLHKDSGGANGHGLCECDRKEDFRSSGSDYIKFGRASDFIKNRIGLFSSVRGPKRRPRRALRRKCSRAVIAARGEFVKMLASTFVFWMASYALALVKFLPMCGSEVLALVKFFRAMPLLLALLLLGAILSSSSASGGGKGGGDGGGKGGGKGGGGGAGGDDQRNFDQVFCTCTCTCPCPCPYPDPYFWHWPCLALSCLALHCLTLPYIALPCVALPCLVLCLVLPCLALPCHSPGTRGLWRGVVNSAFLADSQPTGLRMGLRTGLGFSTHRVENGVENRGIRILNPPG